MKPDGQYMYSIISKWLLEEPSFSDRWSRGTKTLGTRLAAEAEQNSGGKEHLIGHRLCLHLHGLLESPQKTCVQGVDVGFIL